MRRACYLVWGSLDSRRLGNVDGAQWLFLFVLVHGRFENAWVLYQCRGHLSPGGWEFWDEARSEWGLCERRGRRAARDAFVLSSLPPSSRSPFGRFKEPRAALTLPPSEFLKKVSMRRSTLCTQNFMHQESLHGPCMARRPALMFIDVSGRQARF